MIHIPRKKSEVLIDYHGRAGDQFPALNVKHYGPVEYTAERVAEHFGCDKATAERAVGFVYGSAVEIFWEQHALDALNFAMLGDKGASEVKPAGLGESPFKVWAEGRSGGWLVVEGLPDVAAWPGATFQKWRKFARLIRDEMTYLASWDYGREMLEENEWAPKTGTVEANRANAKATPDKRLALAALHIHGELDGQEWSPDTLDRIAQHLRNAGLAVCEPQEVTYVATT